MGTLTLKVCALAVICTAVGVVVKQIKNEISFALRAAGGVLIFGIVLISLEPFFSFFDELGGFGGSEEYIGIMLRSLGVAMIAHVCAGICRDAGEGSIAGGVELAGKIEILILCVPLIRRILTYASEMISMRG